ncbi:50S ribosomal protein L10 [Buchnera aphidicola]|uniref:50S ribosomal protein L10 n=1 Tax=Buchnera aphidicola TaxID=9 RepID=UPI0031B819DE
MILKRNKKKHIIKEIYNLSKKSKSAIIINFSGISTNEINKFRKISSKKNVIIKVIKNTLLKMSIQKTNYKCLKKIIKGPTLIAYSMKHPGSAVRLIKKNKKDYKLKPIIGSLEGKLISIKKLLIIPTYKESIIKLINFLKEICIIRLIKIINIIKLKKEKKK